MISFRKIRSFIRRDGRMTVSQEEAFKRSWDWYGIDFTPLKIDFSKIFAKQQPCMVEIGFGSGGSLLNAACNHPNINFIGIETHKPAIGSLLLNIEKSNLANVRVFYADAVEVLENCVTDESLAGIQIFFPDPWPKRKHRKRRLIQAPFVKLLVSKLKGGGIIHLATDFEDYAKEMMKIFSLEPNVVNAFGYSQFATRSSLRPIITKFEKRGIKAGTAIWELQFNRI